MKTLADAWQSIKQHMESFEASAREKLEQDLPVLADWADKAASNPVLDAFFTAEHIHQAPDVLASLADAIRKIDAALGVAKDAGAAAARAGAAAAEPAQTAS